MKLLQSSYKRKYIGEKEAAKKSYFLNCLGYQRGIYKKQARHRQNIDKTQSRHKPDIDKIYMKGHMR